MWRGDMEGWCGGVIWRDGVVGKWRDGTEVTTNLFP